MKNKLSEIPVYPFLLAINFVCVIYTKYVYIHPLSHTYYPLFISVLLTSVFWLACGIISKDIHKCAFLTAFLVVYLVTYGKAGSFAGKIGIIKNIGTYPELLLVTGLFLAVFILLCRIKKVSAKITVLFNVVSMVMILVCIMNFASAKIRESNFIKQFPVQAKEVVAPGKVPDNCPNIYHFILDEYPIADSLKAELGIDNSDFINELKSLGFYVPPKTHSNYSMTTQSTSSLLNYRYLTDMELESYTKFKTRYVLQNLLDNNRMFAFLKKCGYTTVTTPTVATQGKVWKADIQYSAGYRSTYHMELIGNTPFRVFRHHVDSLLVFNSIMDTRKIVRDVVKDENICPAVVYSHILSPHDPVCLDADGASIQSGGRSIDLSREEQIVCYKNHLLGLNKLILQLIRDIQADSKVPPVIIIQGDHGLRWRMLDENQDVSVLRKYGNLNALYLPGYDYDKLPDDLSLVNTYRHIFNHYFGADLEILEDKCIDYQDAVVDLTKEYEAELSAIE